MELLVLLRFLRTTEFLFSTTLNRKESEKDEDGTGANIDACNNLVVKFVLNDGVDAILLWEPLR